MPTTTEQAIVLSPLAIVIPAYKARFLRATLASLAAQTDQRFQLYVGDDGSPDDLGAIFASVFPAGQADRRFIRFDDNLGGRSLVQQWNRCVAQTNGERWIWLLSDDDIAGPQCVARFHRALADDEGGPDTRVYRFNTAGIDANGFLVDVHPPHPFAEKAVDFAYHRLSFQRKSFVSEYIFRRETYEANGGFADFPFALGSDDASWILFTAQEPIITLSDAMVYWRKGEDNVSLLLGTALVPKLLAMADFSIWMQNHFRDAELSPQNPSLPSKIDLPTVAQQWFDRTMWCLTGSLDSRGIRQLAAEFKQRGIDRQGWNARRLHYLLWLIRTRAVLDRVKTTLRRVITALDTTVAPRDHTALSSDSR